MSDDWDLNAVVRGCAAANSTSTSTTTITACSLDFHLPSTSFQSQEEDRFLFFSDPFGLGRSRERTEDLHDLFEPSFPKLQPIFPQNTSISSPLPVLGRLQDLSPPQQERQQPQQEKQQQNHSDGGAGTISSSNSSGNTPSSRSKRRKHHQLKRVCEVAAEALSSDTWSWRKYGQKPIKGSPYPRGYYKCSTSKGCSARKQVERSRSDPGIFTVTYTGEHNHPVPTNRNSLAGITHQKSVTRETSSSPPVSPVSFSPVSEKTESREEREDIMDDGLEDDVGVSDTGISDDFFEGLEEIAGRLTGDRFTDEVPASLAFLWGVHNAKTTAAGSG